MILPAKSVLLRKTRFALPILLKRAARKTKTRNYTAWSSEKGSAKDKNKELHCLVFEKGSTKDKNKELHCLVF